MCNSEELHVSVQDEYKIHLGCVVSLHFISIATKFRLSHFEHCEKFLIPGAAATSSKATNLEGELMSNPADEPA